MPPRDPPFTSKYSHAFSACYLESLRNDRPVRPTGSRPAPFTSRNYAFISESCNVARSDSAPVLTSDANTHRHNDEPTLHKSSSSATSITKGRPLAQPPDQDRPVLRGRKVSPTAAIQVPQATQDGVYIESAARQLEKEEAHHLREALDLIDQKDEERRVYTAAQQEAADLVWKHRNAVAAEQEKMAPYSNPDLKLKDRRRSSGHRHASASRKVSFPHGDGLIYEEPSASPAVLPTTEQTIKTPNASLPLRIKSTNTLPWLRKRTQKTSAVPDLPHSKKYDLFELHKNPRIQSNNAEYVANEPPPPTTAIEAIQEVETPKSSPSLEIRSEDIRAATSMKRKDRSPNLPTPTAVSDNLGRPIVSFDKSWKPQMDSPRASLDTEQPVRRSAETSVTRVEVTQERPTNKAILPVPSVTVSAPEIPTIHVADHGSDARPTPSCVISAPSVPRIHLPEEPVAVPSIHVDGDGSRSLPQVPSIEIEKESSVAHSDRPAAHASMTGPIKSRVQQPTTARVPWLKRGSLPAVSCSSCGLPISGRIVTAAGSVSGGPKARFHPECFACHHCSTPLECVSFYPEPEHRRQQRIQDEGLDEAEHELRFYCHLDFHEFFSPRCRSCKTPIEGEVIVAAGSEWHVGHFFCGECGDPFDSNTPFVERDGYAYCVGCHTKRTSARCKECKKQILDEITVEALGGKYHEQCFGCFECGNGFGEEGRFFIREIAVEPTDKERRKGIMRKMEEKPVCGACEERRLKA
ncbi:hypothetical protein B0A52_02191 [Exophiala mesophila]|uniref:LIM zinc-binding domain-containing protein n=1 Tax=Exophiala mesophila TaxID=212818 RepID=A0A438NBA5_EXOME|nr:hypothetical protein B0A52_02191 [Exophiala mesophila]